MNSLVRMKCLVCGFLYATFERLHHCQNCFADHHYVRVLYPPPPRALQDQPSGRL